MKLRINETTFDIKKASTDAARKRGLSGIKSMPKKSGLLLDFDNPKKATITMTDMKFPIDLIFISDGAVSQLAVMEIDSEDFTSDMPVDSVLEVNKGASADIVVGDSVTKVGSKNDDGTISTHEKLGKGMHVLDEDGSVQMSLDGDERVISRTHTQQLYDLCVKADQSDTETDYKKVGRAMVRIINKQDTQKDQYSKN